MYEVDRAEPQRVRLTHRLHQDGQTPCRTIRTFPWSDRMRALAIAERLNRIEDHDCRPQGGAMQWTNWD